MNHNPVCFANHMGLYCCDPLWMRQALVHIKAGRWPRELAMSNDVRPSTVLQRIDDEIAIISIAGPIFKGTSKFSQANSIEIRRAVRQFAQSDNINGLLLVIDSPGGTVAGTQDLADEIAAASARKVVHAYIEDLGASAAYWIASQANRITANRTAEIGSIGIVAVVEDTSGAADLAGVTVHVLSTGQYKGAFVDGAPVSEQHLADLQRRVDDLNSHFVSAIARGRRMNRVDVETLADGRLHIAATAQRLRLIDGVGSLDDAIAELRSDLGRRAQSITRRRKAAAQIATLELGG